MKRLSACSRNSARITAPTVDSDGVNPGRSALVESESSSAHTAVAPRQLAEQREVGAPAVDRGQVELEVAGVDDRADGREERDREAVRHRVRDRDELAVDRADAPALTVGDLDELGAVEHPRLFDAVAGEGEREAPSRRSAPRCRAA